MLNRRAKEECYTMLKCIIFALLMVITGTLIKEHVGATIIDTDVDAIIGWLFIAMGTLTNIFMLIWAIELRIMYNRWLATPCHHSDMLFRRPGALR
jgi:hypothetical protein